MVTHRINVMKRADSILVMHRGQIIQRGTHTELVKAKGLYRRAALLQLEDELQPGEAPPDASSGDRDGVTYNGKQAA